MTSGLERALLVARKAVLCAVPAVIFLHSFETVFPFVVAKNVAFRLLVELAVALTLALAIARGRFRPRVTALHGAVLAFLAVLLVADALGADPYRSFFSSFERMEGFVGLAHLGAYFFVLAAALDGERDGRRYLALCFGLAVLEGGWALLQMREIGVLPSYRADARVAGTTGHPSFLAVHLAFLAFVGLFLAAGVANRAWRLAVKGLSGFCFLVALLTGTRAVALAIVALGLFLFVRTTVFVERRLSVLSAVSLVVLAFFAAVLFTESDLLPRDASYVRGLRLSAEDDTAQARLLVWKIAGKGFLARPVLGWGQENFDQPFERFYDVGLLAVEPWFDRPHNVAFDWLLAGGVPAFAGYLGLFAAAFFTLRRAVTRGSMSSQGALLLSLPLVSHLIALSFGVASLETWLPLFALLAVIAALGKSPAPSPAEETPAVPASRTRAVFAVTTLLLWPAAAALHLPSLAQSAALRDAMSEGDEMDTEAAMRRWQAALRGRTFGLPEVRERYARVLETRGGPEGEGGGAPAAEWRRLTASVRDELEKGVRERPRGVKQRILLIDVLGRVVVFDPAALPRLRAVVDETLALSPSRPMTRLVSALALSRGSERDQARAVELARQAVALAPDAEETRVTLAFLLAGTPAKDVKERDRLVDAEIERIADVSPESLERIAHAYERAGEPARAEELSRRAEEKRRAARARQ